MELLNQLTQNLGITEDQARGGTGLILKMARQKLGTGDFSNVTNKIPEFENYVNSAPEITTTEKVVGSVTSALGSKAEGMGDLSSLAGGFSKLGLDSQMISRFVPIVLSFVQTKGGNTTRSILEKVLR
jgi:hypothetical protein